jgi:hypothetical protein
MLGFLLACAEIMFSGIIRGTVLENTRIYNDRNRIHGYIIIEETSDNKRDNYMEYVSGDALGIATDESNASPMLVYLIYVMVLGFNVIPHMLQMEKRYLLLLVLL